jgi:uncharacterized protein (TIGR00369 family)
MSINWSTDHTKDKLPFSYEIVEVFGNKKVNIKIHLTDKCINHFGILHGGMHALIIDEIGMTTFQKILYPDDNYLTSKLTVDYIKPSRDLELLGNVELTELTDAIGRISVQLTSTNGTVRSIGTLEFQVRHKFKNR